MSQSPGAIRNGTQATQIGQARMKIRRPGVFETAVNEWASNSQIERRSSGGVKGKRANEGLQCHPGVANGAGIFLPMVEVVSTDSM